MKSPQTISGMVLFLMVLAAASPVWSGSPGFPTDSPVIEKTVGDALNTTRMGGWNQATETFEVVVRGDYAFIADMSVDLLILDISDPQAPVEVGRSDTLGGGYGVFVSGDYAYTVHQNAGLLIIDVSDPTAPAVVGQCSTGGSARRVFVDGDYAYVAVWDAGLRIIDVSNKAAPVEVGYFDAGSYDTFDVHVSGHYAYLVGSLGQLHIINVNNPATPTEAATSWPLDMVFSSTAKPRMLPAIILVCISSM